MRDEIFIDPKTCEYLGTRSIVVADHQGLTKGDILTWDSNLRSGLSGGLGTFPYRRAYPP